MAGLRSQALLIARLLSNQPPSKQLCGIPQWAHLGTGLMQHGSASVTEVAVPSAHSTAQAPNTNTSQSNHASSNGRPHLANTGCAPARPAAPRCTQEPSSLFAQSQSAQHTLLSSHHRILSLPAMPARPHGLPALSLSQPRPSQGFPSSMHQLQHSRGFLNPSQLKDEFFSPDRQMTSYLISASVVLSVMAAFNRRLLQALVQDNWMVAQGEWWRLLTASFLHGGVLHLLGNMLAVHYLGPPVEHLVNRTSFLLIYFSGALCGGLASYHYSFHSTVLGSSGAIAGLFSAWVVYKLRNRSVIPFTQYDTNFVLQMVAINVLISFGLSGSIAHMAHVGGLLGGGLAMFLIGPRYVMRHGRVVDQPLLPWFNRLP